MGRYTSAKTGTQRRKLVRLLSSSASIPVPVWARDGTAVIEVTGCGAGASGNAGAAAGDMVGGGAGAFAVRHVMPIPAGVSTVAAIIGAGGAAVSTSAATTTPGNPGGATQLTVGDMVLKLSGGGNGNAAALAEGGIPSCGASSGNPGQPTYLLSGGDGRGFSGGAASLGIGAQGGQNANNGYGNGAPSLWGYSTARSSAPAAAGTEPAATGYGAGGNAAHRGASGTATSGAGANGWLQIEFIEGASA